MPTPPNLRELEKTLQLSFAHKKVDSDVSALLKFDIFVFKILSMFIDFFLY